jgi:sugar diacid utilization regulator
MKLNLWIVYNYVHILNPETHIPEKAPANLIGVSTYYSPNCAHIFQRGSDVVVDASPEGGSLIFHEANMAEVKLNIESAFLFYTNLMDSINNSLNSDDYQTALHYCWAFFRNPIILMDEANNVLFLSSQYGPNDVNEDWRYLCENRRSSLEIQQYLMLEGARYNYYSSPHAQIYSFEHPYINGREISCPIYHDNIRIGRMNIIEKSKELNPGDLILADTVTKLLQPALVHINTESKLEGSKFTSVFYKLLHQSDVTEDEISYWKTTSGWSPASSYRIVVCKDLSPMHDSNKYRLLENLVKNYFSNNGGTTFTGNHLVFLYNDHLVKETPEKWDQLVSFLKRFNLEAGISLLIDDIHNLYCYYDQAITCLHKGRKSSNSYDHIFYFYNYACDYLVVADSAIKKKCACQIDAKRLWNDKEPDGGTNACTMKTYLENERSLIATAEQLFIHRNTLVYRIKKITSQMICDVSDAYTREYMLISFIVMKSYQPTLDKTNMVSTTADATLKLTARKPSIIGTCQ